MDERDFAGASFQQRKSMVSSYRILAQATGLFCAGQNSVVNSAHKWADTDNSMPR